MTVKMLGAILLGLPADAQVMLGFDSDIRMNIEIVAITRSGDRDIPAGTVFLTDKTEIDAISDGREVKKVYTKIREDSETER